jgi:hypothetical protein
MDNFFFACHNNGLPITTDDSFKQKGHDKFIAKQVSLLQQIGRGRLVFSHCPADWTPPCRVAVASKCGKRKTRDF